MINGPENSFKLKIKLAQKECLCRRSTMSMKQRQRPAGSAQCLSDRYGGLCTQLTACAAETRRVCNKYARVGQKTSLRPLECSCVPCLCSEGSLCGPEHSPCRLGDRRQTSRSAIFALRGRKAFFATRSCRGVCNISNFGRLQRGNAFVSSMRASGDNV